MKVFSQVPYCRVAPCRVLARPHLARPPGRSLLSRINAGVDVENATQVTLTESQIAELHSRFRQKDGKFDIEAIRVLEEESSLPVKEWFPEDLLERIFEQGFVTFDQFEHLCEANLILEGKLKEYRTAFDAVDRSGNGTIGYNELVDLFGSLGSPMSEAKITELMVEYDLDKSGQIEFGEFLLLFQNQLLDLKEVLKYTKNVEQTPDGTKGLILLKPGEVMKIFTEAEFDEILERNPGKLIVLFAGLTWCRPCKAVMRPYERLAAYYNDAIFLKFFGNANSSTKRLFVERLEAKATPAFFFFRDKEMIHSHTGKDKAKLEGHLRTFITSHQIVSLFAELSHRFVSKSGSKSSRFDWCHSSFIRMERDMFIANYTAWRCQNGLPNEPEIPSLCGMKFDIADLWIAVQSEGGSRRVSEGRRWAAIGRRFNAPATMTNFSHRIKNLFAEYLLEYERVIDPDRAMLKPKEVAKNRSSKTNANSRTLTEDANRSQVSLRSMKRPRSPSNSLDQPLPMHESTPVDRQLPIELYQEALADLGRAYVQCEGLMTLLHGAIENAKIKAQICHQAYKNLCGENNTADNGDGDNNRV